MNRKILVISQTPTHPQNAGNRTRIVNFLLALKEQGHEIHFVYLNRESGDIQKCLIFGKKNFISFLIKLL